jgi:hypothetical protein
MWIGVDFCTKAITAKWVKVGTDQSPIEEEKGYQCKILATVEREGLVSLNTALYVQVKK